MCYCPVDSEAPKVFEAQELVARKEHKCVECGGAIGKGSHHHVASGLWGGEWSRYRRCELCQNLAEALYETTKCWPSYGELVVEYEAYLEELGDEYSYRNSRAVFAKHATNTGGVGHGL
jgi:hypothetical protein